MKKSENLNASIVMAIS